ncbi:MAG: 50S ribosomal protein L44e [Candidatus Thorarchaeota archaeon]
MQIASQLNKYCPRCKSHTVHTLSIYKKGKESTMRQGVRRVERKKKGYGSFPKPIQKRFAKTTKKTLIKMKCADCGHTLQGIKGGGLRMKKVEIAK